MNVRRGVSAIAVMLMAGMWIGGREQVNAKEPSLTRVTSIEGISEYRLANGAQVLLFPDPGASEVTVNMTVFVGSRHEGYGEAGMAHLLEHMLFKGTPAHPNIPELLQNRGAQFNGTTWLDRTNYYETLPAANPEEALENLEFAIRLEADRLMNSFVRGEDLASEMTVVRNEFERGENNPRGILLQRMQSVAYDWHNYGRSTIGNRSDIERVPIDRLRAFYRKFYRPDNVMLVLAGNLEEATALELVTKYFGELEPPPIPLDRTYTIEPPQDGERTVVLRRVGNTQYVGACYHIPAGSHPDYAAMETIASIYGTEPAGRLYQELVLPEVASNVFTMSMGLHDPGLIFFMAQVPTDKSLESARQALLESIETIAERPVTEEELQRAKSQFLKSRELRAANSRAIAIELSEWAAQGDWRLYFLHRDRIEQLTVGQCTEVAAKYLLRNNRTVGLFIPAETSQKVEIPAAPNLQELLADYQGREEVQQGEALDPDPHKIEQRTVRQSLSSGIKTALLPKKTRGQAVHVQLNLRYGNEQSLQPLVTAAQLLPDMLERGTETLNYQQLQDRLDALRTRVRMSGTPGLLSVSIQTQRDKLPEVMELVGQMLRAPRFDEEEFAVLKRQVIADTESQMTEPAALAGLALQRALAPYPPEDIRYVPTFEEQLERYRSLPLDSIRQLHSQQLSGQYGELAAVGDFDREELLSLAESIFDGWATEVEYRRVPTPAHVELPGRREEILTPDKANAVYYGGEHIAMRDDDPDYPAMVVGDYILGAGALSSRLGNRVRQQEGLSYGVGTGFNAHPIDRRARFTLFAITNPANKDRLMQVIDEELAKFVDEGVTVEEVEAARQAILRENQLQRTRESQLASILANTLFANRTMAYYADLDQRIAAMTADQVNEAVRKHLEPQRLIIFVAGDFRPSAAPSAP
ncbi:MAG: peptidase M16 [Pirellulaceae bacterium]|nr:MAG: peptidase M16 [Pirellulaceae bacterium]